MRNPLIPKLSLPSFYDIPAIESLPEGSHRPRWSVIIPTLNRPEMLRCSLESVLAEGYSPQDMQIRVMDNATDNADIEQLVREIGGGRVEYFCQPERVPVSVNWTMCLQQARGEFVHLFHDDDLLRPGFYAANQKHIDTVNCDIVFSQSIIIDDDSHWLVLTPLVPTEGGIVSDPIRIILNPRTFTLNTMVVSRKLYEQIGGIRLDLHYGCDHELCSRLFKVGKVGYIDKPLVLTREHAGRDSTTAWVKPSIMQNYLRAYQITLADWDTQPNRALLYNSFGTALQDISRALLYKGHFRIAFRIAIWCFRVSPSEMHFAFIMYVFRIWLFRSKLRGLARIARRVFRLN